MGVRQDDPRQGTAVTKKYQRTALDTSALAVPEQVSVAMEEIASEMREGLLALAVGAGLQVMAQLMEADVTAVCGPRGRHDPDRAATRHGSEAGSVTLGGRRVPVTRPRVRAVDGSGELPVPAYELFTGTELLGKMAMERMLAGVSTRRYPVALEPVGAQVEAGGTSTSKSAVSRKFVAMTETALVDLLATDLSGLDLVAIMIDGVHFADHLCVVALGIGIDGTKHPLAVVEGSTENTTLVRGLLVGLRDRGLDVTQPILAVLDGAKALSAAVREVFDSPVIGRCQLARAGALRPIWPSRARPARALGTRSATSKIIFRRSSAVWSAGGCGRPTTPTPRWPPRLNWKRWPRSWTRPIPALRPVSARAWSRP